VRSIEDQRTRYTVSTVFSMPFVTPDEGPEIRAADARSPHRFYIAAHGMIRGA
jgi:hypothetical protein